MKLSTSTNINTIKNHNHDISKYEIHFHDLHETFNNIIKIQNFLIQQKINKKNPLELINLPIIDNLLNVYALKVAKKKDTYEKISTLEGICEGNQIFLVKRWKRRCRFLMEIIAELYKIYKNFIKKIQTLNKFEINKIIQNLKIINENDENDNENVLKIKKTEIDNWDILIPISEYFLIDLIGNFIKYKNELNQQLIIKERLFYVLKKAKDQRSRLKIYVNNLRDEIRYTEKKLRETAEIMKNKIDLINEEILLSSSSSSSSSSSLLSIKNNKNLKLEKKINLKKNNENIKLEEKKINNNNNINNNRDYYENRISELEKIIKEEEKRRKHLHNKFQELIGNIRVYCRIKPSENCCLKVSNDDKLIIPTNIISDKITNLWNPTIKCFIFDKVFNSLIKQDEIFGCIDSLITSCVDGYNVCIMSYGESGSGKTYTMMGNNENIGINQRSIIQLLDNSSKRNQWTYKLTLNMIEIYQEEIYDLFDDNSITENSFKSNQIKLFTTKENDVILQGLIDKDILDISNIFYWIKIGENNRRINSLKLNICNSKSHFIVIVKVIGFSKIQGLTSKGTLTLCDLAGSENNVKSVVNGVNIHETNIINKSLMTLGKVFDALRKNRKPTYKDSKLTYLLRPTIGGDSKCLLIVNVKSEPESIHNTLGTLYFGQNAMQIIPEKHQN